MRVLMVTDAFPPKCGGSGWSTFNLAHALTARGHSVEIVQPKAGQRGIVTRRFEGLPVAEFGYADSHLPVWRGWRRASRLDRGLTAFIAERARDVDVIHGQHLLSIPPAVAAGKRAGVPTVSTVRDYWFVCLYGTLWRDGTICPICRGGELARCLRQKYGALAGLSGPLLPLVRKELARRQFALQQSGAVIAVSHFVADRLRGILDPQKVSVVPNLVDLERVRRLGQAGAGSETAPYLLFIGKLNELKGADLLPTILSRAGVSLRLIVVGDGPLSAVLAHTPNVELRGWLPENEALALLAGATALLFPSRWGEPLSRVLLEAQAIGTPTVALDTGGTRDIFEHKLNGLLAGNVQEFAEQVKRLVDDAALRARLCSAARQKAEDRFSIHAVAPQIEAVYRTVQTGQPSPSTR